MRTSTRADSDTDGRHAGQQDQPRVDRVGSVTTPGGETVTGEITRFFAGAPEAGRLGGGFLAALGGPGNLVKVESCAETRLRVKIGDEGGVDEDALAAAGAQGVVAVSEGILHLLVGLNADQYAAEMRGQLSDPALARAWSPAQVPSPGAALRRRRGTRRCRWPCASSPRSLPA